MQSMDRSNQAMEYESFLRWAFGLPQGIHIDQCGDPARETDANSFTERNLEGVKAATAYAMKIYWQNIVDQPNVPQSDHDRLKNFVINVINASTLDDISSLIAGFNESFVERYYQRSHGKISSHDPNN